MHKLLWILVILAALSSCRHKNENLHNAKDSIQGSDTSLTNRKLGFMDCNAVIVGEGVRLRATPETKGEVLEKLNTGTLLKIIRAGDKKVLMGNPDQCNSDGFFWYEVMESGGKRGWVFGEFIYPLVISGRNDDDLDSNLRKLMVRSFMFGEKWYQVGIARSGYRSFVTPGNDSLCVEYLMPFFWQKDQGTILPVKYFTNPRNKLRMVDLTREQNYFRFTVGGMFDDKLTGFRSEGEVLLWAMARELAIDGQEPFTYILEVKPAQSFFSVSPAAPGKALPPGRIK